jgi:subtilase family serine protease
MVEKKGLDGDIDVKEKRNNKVLTIAIITILSALALFFILTWAKGSVTGNVVSENSYNLETSKQQNIPFNVNNIVTNMEGKSGVDLYVKGEGGFFSKFLY